MAYFNIEYNFIPVSEERNNLYSIKDYLIGEGKFSKGNRQSRVLKEWDLNIYPDNESKKEWDVVMDETRDSIWKKSKLKKKRPEYFHTVYAPDPEDNVSPDTLTDAINEHIERVFKSKVQIKVILHGDNDKQTPHGHSIGNNVNLDKNDPSYDLIKYICPKGKFLQKRMWGYICKERGWRNFIEDDQKYLTTLVGLYKKIDEENKLENFNVDEIYNRDETYFKTHYYLDDMKDYKSPLNQFFEAVEKPQKRILQTRDGRKLSKKAKSWKAKGKRLWIEDIWERIELSYMISDSSTEFKANLELLGVKVTETKDGDWMYAYKKGWLHKIKGDNLGPDYTKNNIEELLIKDNIKVNNTTKNKEQQTSRAINRAYGVSKAKTTVNQLNKFNQFNR